ncbi:MAG: hypothetical protein EA385_00235 [Salinarimonadaceae bacterium]|nr:MAG: hypothetical protein EA385_00235 [Salinarimonadaceae bacterium]
MINDPNSPNQGPMSDRVLGVASTHEMNTGSYIDWPAILAGATFAMAIGVLLISFGGTLGLSLTSPYRGEGVSASWLAIAAAIWFAWVMVTSFGAGGYIAGRMRRRAGDATESEVEVRDGAHGLTVWATAVVISAVMAAAGVGGLIGLGASAVGSASNIAAEAIETVDSEYFANIMLRSADASGEAVAPEPEPAPAPAVAPTTSSPSPADAPTAAPAPVVRPAQAQQQPATPRAVDPAIQQQIASIIVRSVASGEMAERDRGYLAQIVAANTDLDATEARARVDEVNEEMDAARSEALAAVEKARVAGVVFGFIAAATLLIGAIAAFFAATAGGRHRDEGLGFDVVMTRL